MEPTEDRSAWTEGDSGETEANEATPHLDLGDTIPPIEVTEEEIVDGNLGDDEDAPIVELLDDDALDEDRRQIEALYGRELSRAKDKVSRWRAMQAKEAFRIGDLWANLTENLSAKEVSAFLASECQIPRRDVARYVRLAETLGTRRQLFVEKGVAVTVLLDLAAQSEEVRDEAVRMIEAGRSLQAKEFRGLKRDIALARAANEGLLDESRTRDLKNAAARIARSAATSWLSSLETLTNEVIMLSEFDRSKSVADFETIRVSRLAKDAGELLAQLPAIAGANFVTRKGPSGALPGRGSWMKVDAALRRIGAGEVFVEVHYQRPLTTVLDFDHDLVWHLAWAFGHDEDTRPESATTRMREAGDVPLDTDAQPGRVRAEGGGMRTVLEICAGAGGQALGLEAAGFHHVGLVEIDRDAVATLQANGPKWPVVHADLRGLDLSACEGVDLLAGGVPCQPYSSAGERRGAHDERDLFPEALRLVRQLRPKAVMLENVTGALHVSNSVNRLRILSQLTSLGYDAEWRILQGPDFGLPQKRRRAILVGFQPGIMHRFRWPRPLDTTAPTVGEALRDLMATEGWPHVNEWAKGADGYAPTLIGGSQNKQGIDLAQDKSRQSWLKLGVNPSGRAKTAPGADTPAGYKPRLTLGMMARIQDFPADWEFKGSDLQVFRQIANAFPPSMAHAVGASIMRALTGSEIDLAAALKVPRRVKPGRLNLAALRSRACSEDIAAMA
ncbi:DNA cytosine methyltransferase [Mesorhizobium sp. ES1-4]|uniref:DNA cytosine methyltransferase n=1 Tax=Mesorhizobium sp. ES1-4 TaxID=2876627 RepID=UPI001CCA93BF|nr:DNA (cytosine-5-)-methyltransferase [Mesorhizobium sp. ES1-4]MBZ9798713.1 DNA (cytosine-5-)-methyltransferase [Mesorhizobium sp. ES1-4]